MKKISVVLENIGKINNFNLTAHTSDAELDDSMTQPTYIQSNKFFEVFQQIVDTYGIPRYSEINPAIFTTITFPFLFGIMFGDIGHGLVLFLFGLYLQFFQEKIIKENKLLKDFLQLKYLIILMGFFSLYCGFLYNDFLSLSLPIFKSCYSKVNFL